MLNFRQQVRRVSRLGLSKSKNRRKNYSRQLKGLAYRKLITARIRFPSSFCFQGEFSLWKTGKELRKRCVVIRPFNICFECLSLAMRCFCLFVFLLTKPETIEHWRIGEKNIRAAGLSRLLRAMKIPSFRLATCLLGPWKRGCPTSCPSPGRRGCHYTRDHTIPEK